MSLKNVDKNTENGGGFTPGINKNSNEQIMGHGHNNYETVKGKQQPSDTNSSEHTCIEAIHGADATNLHLGTQAMFSGPDQKKWFILLSGASFFLAQMLIALQLDVYMSIPVVNDVYRCDGIDANKFSEQSLRSELPHNFSYYLQRNWGYENNNCLFYCCVKNTKYILRFSIVHANLLEILLGHDPVRSSYGNHFENEFIRQTNSSVKPLNDIYYNYIIGYNGFIFEGRPLTCPFEEERENLKGEHSNVIVIGIPYCFPIDENSVEMYTSKLPRAAANRLQTFVDTDLIKNYTKQLMIAQKSLIRALQNIGILNKTLTVQYPDVCDATILVNMEKQYEESTNKLTLYDYVNQDPFANDSLQSYEKLVEDLSFKPVKRPSTFDSKNKMSNSSSAVPPIKRVDDFDCNPKDYINITQDTWNIFEYRLFYETDVNEKLDKATSFPEIYLRYRYLEDKAVNYFLFDDGSVFSYRNNNTECMPTYQKIFNGSSGNYDDVFSWSTMIYVEETLYKNISGLLYLLQPILNDVRKYNPVTNYRNEHSLHVKDIFIFECDIVRKWEKENYPIYSLYKILGFNVTFYQRSSFFFNYFHYPWFSSEKDCEIWEDNNLLY